MGRSIAVALGIAMTVLGLLVLVLDAHQELILDRGTEHAPSFHVILGGLLCIGGLIRIMTAFSIDDSSKKGSKSSQTKNTFDPTDPRWQDTTGPVQVAGKRCVECGQRITIASEGVACNVCSEPSHHGCADLHRAHQHRPEDNLAGPFR